MIGTEEQPELSKVNPAMSRCRHGGATPNTMVLEVDCLVSWIRFNIVAIGMCYHNRGRGKELNGEQRVVVNPILHSWIASKSQRLVL